jgi:hypothetical protein
LVKAVDQLYGEKKDLLLMDNNVVASGTFKDIIAEIRDLGFVRGAKIQRKNERVPSQRRVDFNQGVDARILCKDPMYLRELASVCLKPLRIAFDHLGLKEPYEKAVRYAHQHELTELSNYMLYNFHDSPADLFERMRLNVKLNEELGIRIWSFPMRYQPTDRPDRGHVGEKWTRYQLRSMQIVLQATHGVVSGEPDFFKRAFGDAVEDFHRILMMPHDFVFNRDWYEHLAGQGEFEAYERVASKLDEADRAELLALLSSCDPRNFASLKEKTANPKILRVLPYYIPRPKDFLEEIWKRQKSAAAQAKPNDGLAEDERVEDAGLEFEEEAEKTGSARKKTRVAV